MTDLFTERDKKKAKAFVKGANTGIANLLGFPVDMVNMAPLLVNLLPGKQGMTPFSEKPVGGSQTFKDLMAAGNVGTYKDVQSIPKDEYGAGVAGMLSSEALLSLVPASKLIQQLTKGKKVNLPQPSAGGVDLSRRDLLKKAGAAAVATAVSPSILKEAGDIAGAAVKTAKVVPKGAIISRARDLASDLTNTMIKDLFMSRKERKRLGLPEKPDRTISDNKTVELNTLLEDFMKGKTYEDLMKLSKNDKAELYNLKQTSHHSIIKRDKSTGRDKKLEYGDSAGDPLRSREYGPLLDKVFKDSGIGVFDGKYTNRIPNFGDPPPRNLLTDPNAFNDAFGLNMFPSEKIIKKMVPQQTSLFPTETKKGKQLLIVSCGDKKCPDVGNMKALDRYLGPIFESIKKEGLPENVDVAILSAKHGLIRADTPIENYNQLMTKDKVNDFLNNPNEMNKIAETMQGYDNVLVQGGDNYKNVIKSAAGDIPFKEVPKGRGIGDQRSFVASSLKYIKNPSSQEKVDTLFEAMDEEGALLEFPNLGEKLNRYTFNNDRDALIDAITDEAYPAYEEVMKGMLERTFPSGKIPVRRVENYTELQLLGTKDPETLAMMEQAGLQKLKDQKKVVTEKYVDIEDVKFVGNPAEEELIILDTPRPFRKGAMVDGKQLLSYTIKLPKKVEKKAEGGIAGLSDIARDMFKGPKGIGAYQPFMVG